MSIKRLTDDEMATYLIGLAVRRQLDEAPHDPATVKEIEAVFRWLEHWLPPDEVHCVSLLTGYLINGDFDDGVPTVAWPNPKRPARKSAKPDKPDDIPF